MPKGNISRAGWLAFGLTVVGSLVAIVNEFASFRSAGAIDWGHVALIVGVPAFMYAIVASRKAKDVD